MNDIELRKKELRTEILDWYNANDYTKLVREVSAGLSNYLYYNRLQETTELMELLGMCSCYPLYSAKDYIEFYDSSFCTYKSWEQLVKSEKDISDGLTEKELKQEIGKTIWRLPCGWYVQYV